MCGIVEGPNESRCLVDMGAPLMEIDVGFGNRKGSSQSQASAA